MKKKIMIGLLVLFIGLQLVRRDKTLPVADEAFKITATNKVPSEVLAILDVACMDCHSNETTYPWYSNISPVSIFLSNHITEGREHLNFSEWGSYDTPKQQHKAEEIVEVVSAKEMPMLSYWIIHWDAKISDEQRNTLVSYFKTLQ